LVDGKPLVSGSWLATPLDEPLDLALVTLSSPLEAELVAVPFAAGRVLTRYQLRAAAHLSALPKRASIVIAVDASRSNLHDFEAAAKSAIDAYLSHLPDAQVEILSFNRAPRAAALRRQARRGLRRARNHP
jgi:hypothetical protein